MRKTQYLPYAIALTNTQGKDMGTETHTHPSLTWTDAANQLMNRATVRQQASEKVDKRNGEAKGYK